MRKNSRHAVIYEEKLAMKIKKNIAIQGYLLLNDETLKEDKNFEVGKATQLNAEQADAVKIYLEAKNAYADMNRYHMDVYIVQIWGEVGDYGGLIGLEVKTATRIKVCRRLAPVELSARINKGFDNKGIANEGNHNFGVYNRGDCNYGDTNDGQGNFGDENQGTGNYGHENHGNWNFGDGNEGDDNYGCCNEGNDNLGNDNDGDGNYGNYNAGDNNLGADNGGDANLGDANGGSDNLGSNNVGNGNYGECNQGSYNDGDFNDGNHNYGDENSGNNNLGSGNQGNNNKGDGNQGDNNLGSFNRGSYNLGSFNLVDGVCGYFNLEEEPVSTPTLMFNKPCRLNLSVLLQLAGCRLMMQAPLDREARQVWWDETLSETDRKTVMQLPYFDKTIFKECTGIIANII